MRAAPVAVCYMIAVPMLAAQDVATMRATVFYDGDDRTRQLSRFWILLTLAAIIASAGVVADSTATVIGAMIVAPLMTPIQGTMLAIVLADRRNMLRSLGLVIAGAAAAIAIGFLVGVSVFNDVDAANNSQVAARVSPRLIDLLAALATGVVGSVALARRDISETLPGVAIAISLVPPLTVVGLTLEAGEPSQAAGALLLFITNVAAILATGTIVMAIYGAERHDAGNGADGAPPINRARAFASIGVLFVIVLIPLAVSSVKITYDTIEQGEVRDAARAWSEPLGWEVVAVVAEEGKTVARLEGPPPLPDVGALRDELASRGVDLDHVQIELLPRETIDLGAAP